MLPWIDIELTIHKTSKTSKMEGMVPILFLINAYTQTHTTIQRLMITSHHIISYVIRNASDTVHAVTSERWRE